MATHHIFLCPQCHTYTLKQHCACGAATVMPIPPKYSPEDKYAKYRRQVKKVDLQEKGLLMR